MIDRSATPGSRDERFRLAPRVISSLLTETFFEWYEDRVPRLAAALAYYTVFALAPGLILIIALAGLLLGKTAAQGQIISQVEDLAGEAGAQAVRAAIESARNASGSLLATGFGVVTLLFGLWGVFGELQDALNTIWGVTTRPERFGGVPRHGLYDNTKVVVLGRDAAGAPHWNTTFLDFALRLGFDARLCRPYRAQTKGRVESGIKYVRYNFWPTAVFADLSELNRQAEAWSETVANVRCHGTTNERPVDRFAREQAHLLPAPSPAHVAPFLREERRVGRDGFVAWEHAWYGVPWRWAGQRVAVAATDTTVEIWAGEERLALHPRATRTAQRLTLPGQWAGLPRPDHRPGREPLGQQRAIVDVAVRPLTAYAALVGAAR